MFAIRARQKVASERDFLDAVEKVVRQGITFSSMYIFCSSFIADMLTNLNLIDHYIRCIIRPGGKTVIVHILPCVFDNYSLAFCAFNNGMPLLT
jgi:hypothetical protein